MMTFKSHPLTYKQRHSKASNYIKKPEVRERIFERDGRKCLICGIREHLTIDHIISVYRGGSNDDDNLRTLCNVCNARRSP